MKVIIAGGRDFEDYELLCSVCDNLLSDEENVEIISGKANGADTLGENYARSRGYNIIERPANWAYYGNYAGHIRNRQMADEADALIAFWDGSSTGTSNMIDEAKKVKIKIKVQRYTK